MSDILENGWMGEISGKGIFQMDRNPVVGPSTISGKLEYDQL